MPLTRYQIRNEFNLADPELYRAAEKDDPEALLEGVAMAGLVGLLRQLGDLAEFAAEIFHDLHEEVMATAARGHGLIARIQQLEADVPSIEKNLLSQTNHTMFYYNTGVDWHPQMFTDQNLITQGDMPRFIRDSYEECRGPPQLFLLDKFDIGGAGACLKRYTDPSSLKVEPTTSDAAKLEVHRDRKIRKIKKKGSHWRNGGTPEVLTTSHAKLHQLLLEERIGNDNKDSTRHVILKKRVLDGSKRTKSCMETFLQTISPKQSETDDIEADQPILRLTYDHIDASEREILDIQPVSAADESLYFYHTGQEMKLRPSVVYSYDFSKSRRNRGSTVSLEDGNSIGTASPLHIPVTEEVGVDGDNRNGNGFSSPYYDATANETENYMDALANMDSEAETDNEYIPKKELRYFSKHADEYDSKEQVLESQSVDNSIISDDGSASFIKGTSTSSSHGILHNEEHGNREAESSISMKTYSETVIVDYSDSYDKTEKTTSNRYLNANGDTVGSLVTPYNYKVGDVSVQNDSSQLLQSSDPGLSSRQLTSAGAYYGMGLSKLIYDSELPQFERNRVNGGAFTTPDGPCVVDNVPVVRDSIKMQESNDPSEVLTHRSINFSHDHSVLSNMIENGTLQKGHVNEFSSETLADEEVVSPQSAVDTQLQEFELGYEDKDVRSHLIPLANDNCDSYHDTVSNVDDYDARYATGESLDGFNHVTNTAEENVENNASVLLQGHSYDDGSLYTTNRELAATKSLSETHDSEGHISSGELLSQSVLEDDAALETDSGGNHDNGQAVSPASIYLPSVNRNSDEDFIRQLDSITQEVGDLQTETEVNLEGEPPLPPLPPMQWMAGKPQDSFLDDGERESAEFSMESNANGSLPLSGFGLKSSFHFTPLNGGIKQPLKATETDESLPSTSNHYPRGFPIPTDFTPNVKDAIEENDQLSLSTSDKLRTNSSSIHPRTHLESGQLDTFAFVRDTLVPDSGLCLPTSSTSTNAATIEAMQSSVSAEFSVPSLGDMTADTKEIIQPMPAEHTVLSAGESVQSCTTWESPQSSLGDTVGSKFYSSEAPMLWTNQSPEVSSSYRTEHVTHGNEEEIIKHPGPLIKDEEPLKQERNSSERQASWSLALQNYEDEKLAEKPAFKPPRPRNPLIQSADALDRSKLKKVTTLNRPKPLAVDERGSILEQIRAKSFNLKPAPAPMPKPIIQAPSVNLKVAAILEKANKIRRATAGSDDDDEDDWSDD